MTKPATHKGYYSSELWSQSLTCGMLLKNQNELNNARDSWGHGDHSSLLPAVSREVKGSVMIVQGPIHLCRL